MFEQRGLIVTVKCPTQIGVHQHHVATDRKDPARRPPCLPQIRLQQRGLTLMSHHPHAILNLVSGAGSQREQQWIGFDGQTTQIDDADYSARYRVTDRRPRARETEPHRDVVLTATDECGPPSLQRGANAVGARRLFSQAVARCNAQSCPTR